MVVRNRCSLTVAMSSVALSAGMDARTSENECSVDTSSANDVVFTRISNERSLSALLRRGVTLTNEVDVTADS